MQTRRYDIDWIRVIAIALLLLYHTAIGFQPWGMMIAFITNAKSWESLWIPMSMLNVWRIPLLFLVSGMGVYFAIQNRNWKQLIVERASRILVPYTFGTFCIVPIHLYLWKSYYGMNPTYIADPGHLWFLGNIFCYVLILSPLFYFVKKNELMVRWISKIFSTPLAWLLAIAAFVGEALIVKPFPYELYATTWHGFFLGLLAFLFGFCFMISGDSFGNMILKWRWFFIAVALSLFLLRWLFFNMNTPVYLLVTESQSWIFSVLAFGYRYLNRPSRVLTYLSQAAYPVYILHMIFLYLSSMLFFPLEWNVHIKYVLVVLGTLSGSLLFYEFAVRRIKPFRILFGLRIEKQKEKRERITISTA